MAGVNKAVDVLLVEKGNVHSISHDKEKTLKVVFMNSMRTYHYTPVTKEAYEVLADAAREEGSQAFKDEFKKLKSDPTIKYQEIV